MKFIVKLIEETPHYMRKLMMIQTSDSTIEPGRVLLTPNNEKTITKGSQISYLSSEIDYDIVKQR